MKKRYLILVLVIASIIFGFISAYKIIIDNRVPYTIECIGKKIDTNNIFFITNNKTKNSDTIFLGFDQSKAIMPSSLGWLYYNKNLKQFVLKNNSCIYNPTNGVPSNYFLPFCHSLNNGFFEKNIYYGSENLIDENTLIKRGIKYNTAAGSRENRISLQLFRDNKNILYLKYKTEGILTRYPIQNNTENFYGIFLNKSIDSSYHYVFLYTNTTSDFGKYTLTITPTAFKFKLILKDSSGIIIKSFTEWSTTQFDVGGYLYEIKSKYTIFFIIIYGFFFFTIIVFLLYFLWKVTVSNSPLITSLYTILILIDCIVLLATPIFLTVYTYNNGRIYYLILVLILNFINLYRIFFINFINFFLKNILKKIRIGITIGFLTSLPFLAWKFTFNELLFGIIPILHVLKLSLLLLIVVLQHLTIRKPKLSFFIKLSILLLYSFFLSLITKDYGSFIYAFLAFILIEIIKKNFNPISLIKTALFIVITIFILYKIDCKFLTNEKTYRIISPYTLPENNKVEMANERARESTTIHILNLKILLNSKKPLFNDIVVPRNLQSTFHSDFAILWSLNFGGIYFLIIFISILFLLIYYLFFLLFLSIRQTKINKNKYYILPQTRISELVRFLLAITIIQYIYPVLSNLMILPLTGQSLPGLSISNVEIIFLIILFLALNVVFTEEFISEKGGSNYLYGDCLISIMALNICIFLILLIGSCFKVISLKYTKNDMQWLKIRNEHLFIDKQIPNANNKTALITFAKQIVGTDKITKIDNKKKNILKELASLYYTSKPYNQSVFESKVYANSVEKVLKQISVDSLFNDKQKLISGKTSPFGDVFSYEQLINNRAFNAVTNKYYSSIPIGAQTINADLTALCNKVLGAHLQRIGIASNIGAIVIVDHKSGNIIANASYPYPDLVKNKLNSNEIYYYCGSLKKLLIAYCALVINPQERFCKYNKKNFLEFLQYSDNIYATSLIKNLLLTNKEKFKAVLKNDFDFELFSNINDRFFDTIPTEKEFSKKLDKNNIIYSNSIGLSCQYRFIDVLQWYCRFASRKKVDLNYNNFANKHYDNLTINDAEYNYLNTCFYKVLFEGTASKVGFELKKNGIDTKNLYSKTGTAAKRNDTNNYSSSLILWNDKYTIGLMLNGDIPENKENLSAKKLFNSIIPILIQYNILNKNEK